MAWKKIAMQIPGGFLGIFVLTLAVACVCIYFWLRNLQRRDPPGPVGLLLTGNAHQTPKQEPWRTYAQWGREYGPVVFFRTYLRRFVVLNTVEAALALLEKRSSIYSDRPTSWMLFKLCGREQTVFNINASNPRHKMYRRMLHAGLNASATRGYWPLMQKETKSMIEGFLEEPALYEGHIRKNAAAVIMMVAYGYTVTALDDVFIAHAKETSQITGRAMAPGRWLVDSFPLLRFVPSWLPGAGFKRQAAEWRARFDHLSSAPHTWVKNQIADGRALPSFTSKLLCREDGSYPNAEEENTIQWCATGLYAGAADTTVSALLSFMLLMAVHPDVQRRAQAEVDEKIGRGSLADFGQLDDLPYLTAILKEVLRFAPVGPLGLPHKATQDDEYMGYRIAKDTTVMANVWAIMHDARDYPNPFRFDPDRFTSHASERLSGKHRVSQPDPRKFAFGFGARACPGIQFAERWLLLSMSGVLASCTIKTADSISITPQNLEFTTGHTSHLNLLSRLAELEQYFDNLAKPLFTLTHTCILPPFICLLCRTINSDYCK
ncbi:cytochrome P450 [Phellopilus nigrolimitatus]|nr:cytochrome P450 [Phellopilus nigrolimitatus]